MLLMHLHFAIGFNLGLFLNQFILGISGVVSFRHSKQIFRVFITLDNICCYLYFVGLLEISEVVGDCDSRRWFKMLLFLWQSWEGGDTYFCDSFIIGNDFLAVDVKLLSKFFLYLIHHYMYVYLWALYLAKTYNICYSRSFWMVLKHYYILIPKSISFNTRLFLFCRINFIF